MNSDSFYLIVDLIKSAVDFFFISSIFIKSVIIITIFILVILFIKYNKIFFHWDGYVTSLKLNRKIKSFHYYGDKYKDVNEAGLFFNWIKEQRSVNKSWFYIFRIIIKKIFFVLAYLILFIVIIIIVIILPVILIRD